MSRARALLSGAAVVLIASAWAAPSIPRPWPQPKPGRLVRAVDPRGAMLLLHGGFWHVHGWRAVASERHEARVWQRRGWTTYNADYAPGHRSLPSARRAYRRLRRRVDPDTPICVEGSSSGGHLALLLAARIPAIRCVIARAAPTDLTTLTGNVRAAAEVYLVAHGGRRRWNPSAQARRIRCPVLLSAAAGDPIIDAGQSIAMAGRLGRRATLRILPDDSAGRTWVHAPVAPESIAAYRRVERRFARRAASN